MDSGRKRRCTTVPTACKVVGLWWNALCSWLLHPERDVERLDGMHHGLNDPEQLGPPCALACVDILRSCEKGHLISRPSRSEALALVAEVRSWGGVRSSLLQVLASITKRLCCFQVFESGAEAL